MQAFFASSCYGYLSVSTQTRAAVIRLLAQNSKWVTGDARAKERFAADERKLTRIRRAGGARFDADSFDTYADYLAYQGERTIKCGSSSRSVLA